MIVNVAEQDIFRNLMFQTTGYYLFIFRTRLIFSFEILAFLFRIEGKQQVVCITLEFKSCKSNPVHLWPEL